jgi:hypothetical protein
MPETAVIGLRPHTCWTAAVVLAGPAHAPRVLERRRIVFAEGAERFVFHSAVKLELAAARGLIETVRGRTESNAKRGLTDLLESLERMGAAAALAVAPVGRGPPPGDLEAILRSRALMRAAEGRFYRDVLADACRRLGLEVARPAEHELGPLLAGRLGIGEPALETRVRELGATLGPPWSQDQRLAAQAAWLHL